MAFIEKAITLSERRQILEDSRKTRNRAKWHDKIRAI
jgi:hypothetical protein